MGNWSKKYYRYIINTGQDKKYYSKLYLTVYVDDTAILKPTNFTATYDTVTNTLTYNLADDTAKGFVWDNALGKFVEAISTDYNEAVLTLRNNLILVEPPISEEDLGIHNYGGTFNISAYEVPNIDKFVANINESGITTRIRIEQTESQYFAVTSLAYIFKFDTDFKNW